MSNYSGLLKSISKTGTALAKEGLKIVNKNKGKIILGVVSELVRENVVKSGFSFFSKQFYVAFNNLKPEVLDDFKNQMAELGYKIQLMYSIDHDSYYGKVLNYFHSYKSADKFTYKLPLGLAEYYVTKLNVNIIESN